MDEHVKFGAGWGGGAEEHEGVDPVNEAVERMALRARAGDREARNVLFLSQQGLVQILSRRARSLVRSLEARDRSLQPGDIDQQAFVEFCALVEGWQPEQMPFVAYLRRLLPWRLLHYVRRSLRYRSRLRVLPMSSLRPPGEEHTDERGDPGIEDVATRDKIISIESSDAWKQHTESLDEGMRRAVSLRYGLGFSSREIASIEGRSRRTIDRDLRAAMQQIKRKVQEEWEDCS
ncbi:MAG: sigma factor [Chloroflexia bacterium]|jgi:RNA polymerase sigma factor (sigma-70 family)|nr:sigma factor [Chloroflexia bacterium]